MSREQRAFVEDLEQAIQPVVWRHSEELGKTAHPGLPVDSDWYARWESDWPRDLHDDRKNHPHTYE